MTDSDIRQRQIFEAALELPAEQQAEYLAQNCGGDTELERRVARLLEAHQRQTELKSPVPKPLDAPAQIGPYRVLEPIGEGGMGMVYIAEQTRPVRRRVALKIIKAGMETKEVIARFETERQALAMMNHPNIAGILDVGATELGRPYFVMEYVPGLPIVDYCDSRSWSLGERIALFQKVCDAVQHAHQKGIIHRDLKPSNILVAEVDGQAVPKVIDFGIAKATGQRLGDLTVHTRLGSLIGTPEYMSPEQAEMTALDVDTRADVYSLGAVLYELLVGVPPFRFDRDSSPLEIQKVIVEKDPPAPSLRAAQESSVDPAAARHRGTTSEILARQLRGDLDWISLKALEKDRARRYSSASELAGDLGRFRAQEPVVAGPPSASYRMSKFARRNRGVLLATMMVLIVLVGGIIGTSVGLLRAQKQAARARTEAATAELVTDFLVGLFEVSDPGEARGNSVTAREILDQGAERIERELADQPELQARLMISMGQVYLKLGLYPQAEALLERATALCQRVLGAEHPDTLRSASVLGTLYWNHGSYAEAESLYLETIERQRRVLGAEHPDTLSSINNLANVYWSQGRYTDAEPLYVQTFEARQRVLGDDHPDTVSSMSNLALLYGSLGRYAEAVPLLLETLEAQRRVVGDDHPNALNSLNNLAAFYMRQGRYDEAEPLLLEGLEKRTRVLGAEHPATLRFVTNLAELHVKRGRYTEAESLFLETLRTQERLLSDGHPETALTLYNLGCLAALRGEPEEAMEWLGKAMDAKFARVQLITGDSDLASLHGPAFDLLVEQARENAASLRAD